jgi:hypothetical protein
MHASTFWLKKAVDQTSLPMTAKHNAAWVCALRAAYRHCQKVPHKQKAASALDDTSPVHYS